MQIDYTHDDSSDAAQQLPNVSIEALQSACMLFETDIDIHERPLLERRVRDRVTALLSTNPERLMSILYRIDVAERSVHEVMSTVPIPEIATRLTALLMERMEQKVQTRQQYREQKEQNAGEERQ